MVEGSTQPESVLPLDLDHDLVASREVWCRRHRVGRRAGDLASPLLDHDALLSFQPQLTSKTFVYISSETLGQHKSGFTGLGLAPRAGVISNR